ncbi:MAG: SAM-dependent methyltransferase [Xanthobacteraceae bacterium]
MTTAFSLIHKALSREVPSRAVLWGLLNTINRSLKTGNRRFEFERLYLENSDPWNYETSEYERDKYRGALDTIVRWRRSNASVLEIGCSVGVFSEMLSGHFAECVAVDMSEEALRIARSRNGERKNLRFVRSDVRSLHLRGQFDVITCAETLYYIDESDADRVASTLANHLSGVGILVSVSGVATNGRDVAELDACEVALSRSLEIISRMMVADPRRPYRIVVFGRPSTPAV